MRRIQLLPKPNRVIGMQPPGQISWTLLGSLGNSNHRPYRRPGLSKIEPVPWPRAPNPHFRQPIVALSPGTKKKGNRFLPRWEALLLLAVCA